MIVKGPIPPGRFEAIRFELVPRPSSRYSYGTFSYFPVFHGRRKADYHLQAVSILAELDRPDETNGHIKKAVELGSSVSSLQNLAWPFVTAEDEPKRKVKVGLQLAQELVAILPDGYFVARTLGVAHYRNEDWQASIDELQRATKLKALDENTTHHAIPWFFLAMAHWQLGEKDVARECFDKSVAWMDANAADNAELIRFRREAEELMAEDGSNDESN